MISVLLICDASVTRGSGHFMRMVTLATAIMKNGHYAEILMHECPPFAYQILKQSRITLRQRSKPQSSYLLDEDVPVKVYEMIVFDGYDFQYAPLLRLYERGEKVVVWDDNGENSDLPCHIIYNQNMHAEPSDYSGNRFAPKLALGTQYALIREGILRGRERSYKQRDSILVSAGGTDSLGLSPRIAKTIGSITSRPVLRAEGFSESPLEALRHMEKSISNSLGGVIACGTTTGEMMAAGVPFVGIVTVDNQMKIGQSLSGSKLASVVDSRSGDFLGNLSSEISRLIEITSSQNSWERESAEIQRVVDGNGAMRTLQLAQELLNL